MKLRDLAVYGVTAACLLVAEFGLEVRAYRRGWDTLLFDRKAPPSGEVEGPSSAGVEFGPTDGFPFRSRVLPKEREPGSLRIMVTSSSFAADPTIAPGEQFPAVVEGVLREQGHATVEVLNASAPGRTLVTSIGDLSQLEDWRPDYVVLYQMTNDITRLSRPGALDRETHVDQSVQETDVGIRRRLSELWENTTLFAQLREHVTTRVTAHRFLKSTLGEAGRERFRELLVDYVATAIAEDVTPVLLTFVSSHAPSEELPDARRYDMLRWNQHLAPEGVVRTVAEWNQVIREVGAEYGVPVVDMASGYPRDGSNFKDFVHFTTSGHERFGRELADGIARVLGSEALE